MDDFQLPVSQVDFIAVLHRENPAFFPGTAVARLVCRMHVEGFKFLVAAGMVPVRMGVQQHYRQAGERGGHFLCVADGHPGVNQQRFFGSFQQEEAYHSVLDPPGILVHLNSHRAVLLSAAAAFTGMDGDHMPAVPAGPLFPLLFQELLHSELPDLPQVFPGGFIQRVFGRIAVFLLHDVRAGIIRAFVTEFVSVLLPLFAENDAAPVRAELRFLFIGAVASRAGVFFRKRPLAETAVQTAGGDHLSGDEFLFHFSTLLDRNRLYQNPGCKKRDRRSWTG